MSLVVRIPGTGIPDVMETATVAVVEPSAGEVRVAIELIGVNFADVMIRMGLYPDAPPFPMVPGYEAVGTIEAVGEGVPETRIGESVLVLAKFGCYAEHVCVPSLFALRRPDNVDLRDAAALAVNWLTAYQMLEVMAPPRPGETVLIHGAAGGVGQAAVQLAQRRGARVIGSASPAKHDMLRQQGLDLVFDSRRTSFAATVQAATGGRGADVVLEPRHGRWILESYKSAAVAGRVVLHGFAAAATGKRGSRWSALKTVLEAPWLRINPISLMNDNKALMGVNLGRLWHDSDLLLGWLEELMGWLASGEIKPRLDRIYPLERADLAHHRLQDRLNFGKILLATSRYTGDDVVSGETA